MRPCSMSTNGGAEPGLLRRFLLAELLFGAKHADASPRFLSTSKASASERGSDRHFARVFFVNRGMNLRRFYPRTRDTITSSR